MTRAAGARWRCNKSGVCDVNDAFLPRAACLCVATVRNCGPCTGAWYVWAFVGACSIKHQTRPYEWSHRLGAQVPTVAEETRAFTDAYVAAEYGPSPPSKDEVHQARRWWRRIERVLLRRR
jgi:hypothetical protein